MKAIIITTYLAIFFLLVRIAPLTTCPAMVYFLSTLFIIGILVEIKKFREWFVSLFDDEEE